MSKKGLSDRQRQELDALEKLSDDAIDTSDISEITEEQWRLARRGDLYRPLKKSVTIRLDADVIEWFKEHAADGGYQTDINSVLRQHVAQHEKKSA
jgi:uncharacterized protein (DUF4415 family)